MDKKILERLDELQDDFIHVIETTDYVIDKIKKEIINIFYEQKQIEEENLQRMNIDLYDISAGNKIAVYRVVDMFILNKLSSNVIRHTEEACDCYFCGRHLYESFDEFANYYVSQIFNRYLTFTFKPTCEDGYHHNYEKEDARNKLIEDIKHYLPLVKEAVLTNEFFKLTYKNSVSDDIENVLRERIVFYLDDEILLRKFFTSQEANGKTLNIEYVCENGNVINSTFKKSEFIELVKQNSKDTSIKAYSYDKKLDDVLTNQDIKRIKKISYKNKVIFENNFFGRI